MSTTYSPASSVVFAATCPGLNRWIGGRSGSPLSGVTTITTLPRGSSEPLGANAVACTGLGPAVAASTKDCNETPSGNEVVVVTGAPGIATVEVVPSEFVIKVIGTSTVLAPERTSALTVQAPMTETTVPCP